jgi:NAD(P)-dependent dehydrogenase (short-subunit alcohol dehydrogenase family)
MTFIHGGVAVVTGAGSGIGRALAVRLAAAGSAVALADVDEMGLMETAASISGKRGFAEDVSARHGRVSLLINNAGVSLFGTFEEVSLEDFRWLMGINLWGAIYGVRYFLPLLRRERRAHVVNLSSLFGLIAPPGQMAYSTSKFAVRGFTEALRHELAGSSVGVSCVYPAGVRTAIARKGRVGAGAAVGTREAGVAALDRVARISPEEAAERILLGVERGEGRILIGGAARRIDWLQRLRPGTYWKTLAKRYERG